MLNRQTLFETLRQNNRALILRQFCLQGPLSLNGLAERTALSRASLMNYLRVMQAEGLLGIVRRSPSTGGRRGALWDLLEDARWFAGIAVANGELHWNLLNLKRERVGEGTRALRAADQGGLVNQVVSLIETLRRKAARAQASLEDLTLAVKGVVHPHAGIVFTLDEDPEWTSLALTQLWHYPFPVRLVNYATAVLLRRKWAQKQGDAASSACLYVGNLLQVAVMDQGVVCRGEIGTDIDIGHVRVMPDGDRCHCGRRGCFLTVATRANHQRLLAQAVSGRAGVEKRLALSLACVLKHVGREFGVQSFVVGGYPAELGEAFRRACATEVGRVPVEWLPVREEGAGMAQGAAYRSLEGFLRIDTFRY